MANKKRNVSKSFKKVKKINVFVFVNSSFVYETCGKLRYVACMMRLLKKERREKIKLKDTNLSQQAHSPVLVSRKK